MIATTSPARTSTETSRAPRSGRGRAACRATSRGAPAPARGSLGYWSRTRLAEFLPTPRCECRVRSSLHGVRERALARRKSRRRRRAAERARTTSRPSDPGPMPCEERASGIPRRRRPMRIHTVHGRHARRASCSGTQRRHEKPTLREDGNEVLDVAVGTLAPRTRYRRRAR